MAELTIPVAVERDGASEHTFRIVFRSLIVGSMLRSAERELETARSRNRRVRGRLAEHRVTRLRLVRDSLALDGLVPVDGFGRRLRLFATAALAATGTLMLVELAVLGVHSRATTVTVVATQVLTILWFFTSLGARARERTAEPEDEIVREDESIDERAPVVAEAHPPVEAAGPPVETPGLLRFADDRVTLRRDGTSGVLLKAVTEAGEPVDLAHSEATRLSDALRRLSDELES